MTPPDRPHITPELVERFAAYYEATQHGWGALHIVLSDGNVRDRDVDFCIEFAEERGDVEGAALGRILFGMSRTQRFRIGHLASREPA